VDEWWYRMNQQQRMTEISTGTHAGCYDLLTTIQQRVQPQIAIFGHIHEGYGCVYDGTTIYINASIMNCNYEACNLPIVIDLPSSQNQNHKNDESAAASSSSSSSSPNNNQATVVQPQSMFHNNDIHTLNELIEWCLENNHPEIGQSLQDVVRNRPHLESSLGIKGGDDEGSADGVHLLDLLFREQYHAELLSVANTFLTLCDVLTIHPPPKRAPTNKNPRGVALRRQLAMMISHLYALSF